MPECTECHKKISRFQYWNWDGKCRVCKQGTLKVEREVERNDPERILKRIDELEQEFRKHLDALAKPGALLIMGIVVLMISALWEEALFLAVIPLGYAIYWIAGGGIMSAIWAPFGLLFNAIERRSLRRRIAASQTNEAENNGTLDKRQ
jgi:hypothetical protein